MDTISTLISHINLQNQQTTTTQPSPQLTTSINQLRSFSTALSAFINHYDELHTHINFINSSIDSILPPHLLQTVVNPNSLITSSDRRINDLPQVIVSEQNPRESVSDCERSHESATAHDSTGLLLEVVDVSNNIEEIDVFENHVGIEVLKDREEIDALKERAETVNNNQTIAAVPEAIVSDQNPNTDGEQSDERLGEIIVYKKSEEIDSLMMNLEEPDTSKTREINDVPKNHVEMDNVKKAEETVPDTSCDDRTITAVVEAVVLEPKFNGMADNCELSHENVRTPESLEEIDVQSNILKKPEQTDSLKKKNKRTGTRSYDKESVALNKFGRKLQFFCKKMNFKGMKWHIVKHISKTFDLREEIAKALKLAKDPAKLVLNSIGIVQGNGAFCQDKQSLERKAAVLILECFVMISSDDGIEIAKVDQEYAAQAAVDWRERMIREGGFGHTDEVDARGLLLLISGFGIQDDVFNIQDIVDLVRASNVKGISTALRCSVFLMPKIPEVINLMVKNNLEIEAVDMAYAFGLEDICNPRNILTTYLLNIIEDIQNNSPFQMVDVAKQQLFDLKSIKQCLESHNVDPSVLLPDIKINEKIQNLENEVNKWKIIQKRKSLENPFQQETKRACFGHESMTSQQKPVDHYGMNRFNQSTQLGTSYFDSDRNSSNSYITNHSASSVYNASAMPENMPDLVPNGLSGGFPGSYDQAMRTAKEFDVSTNPEEINALKKHAETDSSKKPEETVLETSCDQPISATPEAIVLEQNPNGMATNGEQSHENTDICKNPKEAVVLKKPEELVTLVIPEELNTSKKPEETVPQMSCDQTTRAVSKQNPNRMATKCDQSHENVSQKHAVTDVSKKPEQPDILKPEQTDIYKNPEEIDTLKKHEETSISKKDKESEALKKVVFLCQSMRHKEMKWHVAEHLSELSNLRVEVANALRLAEDPAQLVLNSIGSGDGIKIAKSDQERAAQAAVDWRKRIISEGGLEHTDEVDARGLLLLISGFGIENHVFRTQDIMALIRASNVKGISTALRRSVFLIPKIPMVIFLMVKHNLEIEAVDVAYTFGLEDMCHPRNILTTYLHKKVIDFQNSSVSGMLEAMKQYLSDLKSVKQCLESHNVDPSTLLPDFKINEKIQNLEKEVNEWKLTQKREPLENPLYQEAKRACNGHENMHCQQKLIDRYGMNQFNSSTQLSTGCNDSDQNFGNTYVTNHSVSSVYDASAMPENIPCLVPNGQAGGFPGSYDQTMYEETVRETSCDQTLNVVPEAIVSEQNPNKMATNCDQRHENVKAPESLEEIDVSKKHAVINTSKKPEQTDICKNPEETVVLKKPGVIDTSMVPEETYTSKYLEEIDTSEKPGETLPETSCDQTTPVVPEAIVSEQNPNGMATNHEQSHEYSSKKPAVISIPKKPEQTDICKNPEETVVLKKLEELDASMNQEEIHTSNKPELHEESGIPNGTATNREQSHENASKNPAVIGISKKLEQTDICENPEETVVLKKPEELDTSMNQEEIDTSKKPELVDICKNPEETGVLKKPEEIDTSKKHEETKHFSEMINLREEIAKALKLAKDPAQLVLNSIGRAHEHSAKVRVHIKPIKSEEGWLQF
ncbi:hypothetical protein M8C21_032230 [Ambrosia artemisiifolia]|uniref:FRIGIDA-like protein n=1 Tax=Ambrosia artemisiifolia TaxID=4212 RepID=A0AAD5BY63_AMBAR|nr:hypothetical protein M8C21_032230 [Ambrosia artemisiifolia]